MTKKADNPCWEGYEPVGTKTKDGKQVPNCVPVKDTAKASVVLAAVNMRLNRQILLQKGQHD